MQNAEKLSITLPAEMARMIRKQVEDGIFSSNSEAIRYAMRPWFDRERKLAELDAKIMEGLADADAGRVHTAEDVLHFLRERFKS